MADEGVVAIIGGNEQHFDRAIAEGGELWIEAGELARKSGWELKPEGICHGDLCFPLRSRTNVSAERDHSTYLNVTALADQIGFPWVADSKNKVWFFGADPTARGAALQTLKAPDFELPDLDGRTHRLSDHLGKKVLIVSWASW